MGNITQQMKGQAEKNEAESSAQQETRETTGSTSSNPAGEGNAVAREGENARDNVKSLLSGKVKSAISPAGWQGVKDKASQMVSRAGDVASDVAGKAQKKASDAVEGTSSLIRRYPVQAVLIGFGLGAIMTVALRSRRA